MVVTAPPPQHQPEPAVEGGVIDDARDRQRRHRLAGAALTAAALAIGAVVVGLVGGGGGSGASQLRHDHAASATPGAHGSAKTPPIGVPWPGSVSSFGLLAPGVGWVGVPVYLTRNGGRSWVSVSPKTLGSQSMGWTSSPGARELAISFADGGQNALIIPKWASAARWVKQHVHGHIVISTDAGRTWSSEPFVPGKSPGAISFLNGRRGFVLGFTAASHHDPRASLYETRDGARTWTRVAAVPFTGMLSFANARYGLGGGQQPGAGLVDGAAIYRTSDGGRSWKRTPLCGMHGPACGSPYLFPSGRGVVLATAGTQQSDGAPTRVEVYTTRNNGVGWTKHILPDTPRLTSDQEYIPFSAPDANDLFAWVTPYLYASHDGGRSWSRYAEPVLNPLGLQPVFTNIAFANARYGWYSTLSVFAYTTDGGRHWTKFRQTR